MTRIFIVCGIIFMLFACKKDKLVGDLAVFQGRWKMEWYIKNRYYPSIQSTAYDTVTVMTDSFEMEFEKKGKVRFIRNGEEVEKYRVSILLQESEGGCTFNGISSGAKYSIALNNDGGNFMNGCINSTSLYAARDGFPFIYHDEGNARVSYRCYFKKQ